VRAAGIPIAIAAGLHCSIIALQARTGQVSLWWLGLCPAAAVSGGKGKARGDGSGVGSGGGGSSKGAAPATIVASVAAPVAASVAAPVAAPVAEGHAVVVCDSGEERGRSKEDDTTNSDALKENRRNRVILAIGSAREAGARAGGDMGGEGRRPVACAVMGVDVDSGDAGCAGCRAKAFLLHQLRA